MTTRLRDCAYSFFKQISKISDKNLPDDEMKALTNLIENKIINEKSWWRQYYCDSKQKWFYFET